MSAVFGFGGKVGSIAGVHLYQIMYDRKLADFANIELLVDVRCERSRHQGHRPGMFGVVLVATRRKPQRRVAFDAVKWQYYFFDQLLNVGELWLRLLHTPIITDDCPMG